MRKKDIILFFCIIVAGILGIFIGKLYQSDAGFVHISVDGSEYGVYSINDANVVEITNSDKHTNTVMIENGCVYMKSADCPDKICVKQGVVRHANEIICCAPNRVIVTIIQNEEGEYDAISR